MENWITNTSQLLMIVLGMVTLIGLIVFISRVKKHKKERRIVDSILDAAAIPVYRHSLPQLKKEIARARRYQHPLSVIIVQPSLTPLETKKRHSKNKSSHKNSKNGTYTNGEAVRISQIEFMLCGPIFRDALREVDRTTYDGANNRFIMILPESTKIQAVQTVNRLKTVMGEKLFGKLQIGISEFPKDGLIMEDLICRAMPKIGEKVSDEANHKTSEEIEVQPKLKS